MSYPIFAIESERVWVYHIDPPPKIRSKSTDQNNMNEWYSSNRDRKSDMKRTIAVLVTLLSMVVGCGSKPDAITKEMVAVTNQLADTIETGKSRAAIQMHEDRLTQLRKELNDLNLPSSQLKALAERHQDSLESAEKRLTKASFRKGNERAAKAQMEQLNQTVETYMKIMNRLPESLDDLRVQPTNLRNAEDWVKLLDRIPKDPWNVDFVYEKKGNSFEIRCAGADRKFGTSDDLTKDTPTNE
jgi:chromosome segregation ATPase